jgi:hypothetical protein
MTTFIPPARRTLPIAVARKAAQALPLLAVMAITMQVTAPAAEAPRRLDPPARMPATKATAARPTANRQPQAARTVVDAAVQPAGGAGQACGPTGCKTGCRHGHHRDCRDGACVPYCPVRPTTFGFYGTQWRRWPGSGVVPVSNEQAATPAKPPKSAVPGPDEESLGPKASELPEPDFPAEESAAGGRTTAAPEPDAPEPQAATAEPAERAVEPAAPEPMPETEAQPAQPEAAPAKPRPQDENLFDDSAAGRVRRKIPVASGPQPAPRPKASRVQPATHQQPAAGEPAAATRRPAPTPVPRVAFDPRSEAARMRQPASPPDTAIRR